MDKLAEIIRKKAKEVAKTPNEKLHSVISEYDLIVFAEHAEEVARKMKRYGRPK